MFSIGDYVINGKNGICKIEDIVQLDMPMATKDMQYFLLVPEEQKSAKLYIPIDGADHKVRKLMSADEAWALIDRMPEIQEIQVEYEKQREQKYREILSDNQPEQLISIIKSMYFRRLQREQEGKKSIAIDERYFKLAESNLYAELSYALGKDKKEMEEIIGKRIEESETEISL